MTILRNCHQKTVIYQHIPNSEYNNARLPALATRNLLLARLVCLCLFSFVSYEVPILSLD
jgi:hypothetical protein